MAEILTTLSVITCLHGGKATLVTPNTRVTTDNGYWLLETDIHVVMGCPLTVPCVRIEWSGGSTKTKVNGTSVLTRESVGKCYNPSNAEQGQAIITYTQMRATTQ